MKALFDEARKLHGSLSQKQVDGFNALLKATEGLPTSWRAYILATAWHETAFTMQPIAEYGKGRGRPYGVPGRNRGQIAYGRGYVQLTWDDNYELLDRELGLAGLLVENYELALKPDIAADILVVGMTKGLYNGKRKGLKDFIPCDEGTEAQFVQARRTVNVLDKAMAIAKVALAFQKGLKANG